MESSRPRDRTQVSRTVDRHFTVRATRGVGLTGGEGGWCNVGEGRIRSWEVGRPVSRDMGCHSNTSPCLASNQIWTVSVTSGNGGPINPANGLQPPPHRSSGLSYGEGWRCRVPTILGN